MLGEILGEERGKVTLYRVLPPEGGAPKVEVSFQGEYLRRTVFNFAKHRRVEHYGLITSRTGAKTEV